MITATVIVKNGERHLHKVLSALQTFPEVVLLDTGSSDQTLQIASTFPNVAIHHAPFQGFGAAHNLASALARHEWILSIDADEVLSPELVLEIQALILQPQTLYALPFHNFFNGKHIKGCGWHPETHIRLYHKGHTAFSETRVHEGVICKKGDLLVTLRNPVYHYSYATLSDFLRKMELYSTLFAEEYKNKKRSSPAKAFYHAVGAFLKSYVLKRGFLDGHEGFLISGYQAQTAFYKYLKLYYLNRE